MEVTFSRTIVVIMHLKQKKWLGGFLRHAAYKHDLTLHSSNTYLQVPDFQFINIYHKDMILSLISPTVKDTSNVRNVIQYFVPDVASTASLSSLLVTSGYLNQNHYVID